MQDEEEVLVQDDEEQISKENRIFKEIPPPPPLDLLPRLHGSLHPQHVGGTFLSFMTCRGRVSTNTMHIALLCIKSTNTTEISKRELLFFFLVKVV